MYKLQIYLYLRMMYVFIQTMIHFPDARRTLESLVSFYVNCDEHTPGVSPGGAYCSPHLRPNGSFSGKHSKR